MIHSAHNPAQAETEASASPSASLPSVSVEEALDRLARLAVGLSGADIERLVREARGRTRRQQRLMAFADLKAALLRIRPQRSPELRYRIAVHEAGHALLRHVLEIGVVISLSVMDRDGGSTTTEEPPAVQTETWLMKRLAVCFGGRAAEAAVFDAVTGASGGPAHSDLAQATRIALSMETSLGLGADHPLVHRDVDLAGHLLLRDRDLLDRVDARLQAAMEMAQHIVEAHRDRLLRLAAALATSGTLDAGEIASILDTRDSTRPSIPESSG